MSNALAIAAVTATLKSLLQKSFDQFHDVPGVEVTTRLPHQAQEEAKNRVNLFLYHTSVNAGWSNMNMPPVKAGETGFPPLALNLYYLLSAYGQNDDDMNLFSHRILGQAMRVLYDHPVLDQELIKAALPGNDLHEQIERVRITPQPLSIEELSKLWTIFQAQYRISVAYQLSVVLIESTRPTTTPLPVLRRGRDDRGVISQPDLLSPFPTLTRLELASQQPSLQFRDKLDASGNVIGLTGDELTLHGHHLAGDEGGSKLQFIHARLSNAEAQAIAAISPEPDGSDTKLTVKLSQTPDALTKYPAGFYQVAVAVTKTEEIDGQPQPITRLSNALSFTLAPRVIIPANPITQEWQVLDPGKPPRLVKDTLTLQVRPQVWKEQQVKVLLGTVELAAQDRLDKTDMVVFDLSDYETQKAKIPEGEYRVRLRIDGVDSLLVEDYQATPLRFDETQKVTIPRRQPPP